MPAPGIWDGAILTLFGLMLGLGAFLWRFGLLFDMLLAFDFALSSAAAAAALSLALAVVLRVLCLLLVFATLGFVVILLTVAVSAAVSVLADVLAVLALAVDPRMSLGVKVVMAATAELSSTFEQAVDGPVLGVVSRLASLLSLLLLKTAASASSQVGMRIAAILRISLRTSPGVFLIFFG